MIERIRERGFDAAAIFTVYSQNPLAAALLCYLAGVPLRLAHCRENAYQLLTTRVPESEPEHRIRHEVRRQLDLVAAVGCSAPDERLSLRVPLCARASVDARLASLGLDHEQPWIVLHPGATAPSRRYPLDQYAAAASSIARRTGATGLLTGDASERALADRISAAIETRAHTLAGALSLAELCALIAAAPVLVTNNTGPAHIAAAVGTPVVDLYALTNPQHTPWMVTSRVLFHDVPCKYCYRSVCPERHHECLRRVPPEAVADAACELLSAAAH
jgi:lipopolysaccharide heptosyltransferase II